MSTDSVEVSAEPSMSSPLAKERAMMEKMSRMEMITVAEDIDPHISRAKLVARIVLAGVRRRREEEEKKRRRGPQIIFKKKMGRARY